MRFGLLIIIALSVAMPAFGEDCGALVGQTLLVGPGDPLLAFEEKRADGFYQNQRIPPGQKFQVTALVPVHYGDDKYTVLTRDGRQLSITCQQLLSALDPSYFGQRVLRSAPEDFAEARALLKAKQDAADADAVQKAAQAQANLQAKLAIDQAELAQKRQAEVDAHSAAVAQEARRLQEERRKAREYMAQRLARGGVRIGMSEQQVLSSSWGEPSTRNHTITTAGDAEQWVYGMQYYLYFVDGILVRVQSDSPDSGYFQVAH